MKKLQQMVGMGLLFVTASVAWAQTPQLQSEEVRWQNLPREVVVDALIEAVYQTTVSAQTSGRITEVLVDVDDFVNKGDVLLRFRDKEQRAALRAADAHADEALAAFNRMRELLVQKLVSKAEFDKAHASLKAAAAAQEQAQEQLEYTVVRAPYSGIVVKRHVEPGESASPGKPLMTGLSLESLRAVANLPQDSIDRVRTLQRARVLLPDEVGDSVAGGELTISPFADATSHTFKIRVELPEGEYGVYPGMFVKVAFMVGEEKRLIMPAAAVVHRSEVTGVYLLQGEQIHFRYIRLGSRLPDGRVEVLAGLQEGDRVAMEPIRAGVMLKAQRSGKEK